MENGQYDSQNPISTNNSNNTKKRYNKYLPFLLAGIVAVGLVACKFLQKESVPAMAEAVIATETEEPDEEVTEQENGQGEPEESDSVAKVSDMELDGQSKDNLTTSEPEDNLITSEPEDLNKEDNLSQVEEQSESDEIIDNMEGTEQTNNTPSQSPSNSPTTTPDTSQIESELEAELESIIESTNPADITDTPVQIEGETQQENSASSVPSGGQTQTPSGNQGNAGQTQTLSGTQGTPSQDTEVKQPDKQTQQNGAANNQVQSNQGNTSTSGGARLTGPDDPRFDPNYVNPRTGVMLDYDGNGIPDPIDLMKPGKVETVDGSKYGFVKPK